MKLFLTAGAVVIATACGSSSTVAPNGGDAARPGMAEAAGDAVLESASVLDASLEDSRIDSNSVNDASSAPNLDAGTQSDVGLDALGDACIEWCCDPANNLLSLPCGAVCNGRLQPAPTPCEMPQ